VLMQFSFEKTEESPRHGRRRGLFPLVRVSVLPEELISSGETPKQASKVSISYVDFGDSAMYNGMPREAMTCHVDFVSRMVGPHQ
jgi:hypothetical protein